MLEDNLCLSPCEIRESLKNWVQKNFSLKRDDLLIDELGFINKASNSSIDNTFRADLALANSRLVGFEIKSKKDTLKRWHSQMNAYTNVFDEIWLCSHSKHLVKALEISPKHIGILAVDDLGSITIIRYAHINNENNFYDLSGLLWKNELLELAQTYELNIVKSRMTKNEIRDLLSEKLSLDILKKFILKKLKYRKCYSSSIS